MSSKAPRHKSLALVLGAILAVFALERASDAQLRAKNIESFEYVWKTIRDKHWDPKIGGLDWQAIHDELRPKIEQADSLPRARELMQQMLSRLGQSHFAIIASDIYGDLGTRSREEDAPAGGDGITGMDVRVVNGQILVTSVNRGSPAWEHGVRAGWLILRVRGKELAPLLEKIGEAYTNSTQCDYYLRRAVLMRMAGRIGEEVRIEFQNQADQPVQLDLVLSRPRGNPVQFGHLPTEHVWIESRLLKGNIGYIAFNYFMDPAGLMPQFEKAIRSFRRCQGIILDVRGNPGGIGAMSMGMAGWFIGTPDQTLGTMFTRQTPLRFVITPRAEIYDGPLAILADGCSVSTAEIFAGGLKDLRRARVFGTRTAGAALPSIFEMLPNGDGFQYAIANYLSEGGRPLEGIGVVPDEEIRPSRAALLTGQDPVVEAAVRWIRAKKRGGQRSMASEAVAQ